MDRRIVVVALVVVAGCLGFGVGLTELPGTGTGQCSTADASLEFEEVAPEKGIEYYVDGFEAVEQGGGVYVADVDNDGWQDVLALRGRHGGGSGPTGPTLYTNENGSFEESGSLPVFENRTIAAALFVDYDRDGWEDLLLFPLDGKPVVLANDRGEFRRTGAGPDVEFAVPMGATAADYDGDGDADVFVYQNGDWLDRIPVGRSNPNRTAFEGDNGEPNLLLENTEDGFEPVENSGISGDYWTLAASFVDLTGDGTPDIHVANDYNNDVLYLNRGNGTFEKRVMGEVTDRNAMSSEIVDMNGDGRLDIYVTNIYFDERNLTDSHTADSLRSVFAGRFGGNNLLINRGDGRFEDRAERYGLRKGGWGWAAVIADLTNDGRPDAVHTTKEFTDAFLSITHRTEPPEYYQHPAVWRGTAGGFAPRNGTQVGFGRMDSRGLATLDFDRDGDLDLLVSTWSEGSRYRLYENVGAAGNWLKLTVRGNGSQTATGAEVYITTDGNTTRTVRNANVDYLSQDSRVLHFGLGGTETVDRIRVVWPDGTSRTVEDVAAGQSVVVDIDEGLVSSERPPGSEGADC